jgi:hypothetical protein
MARNLAMTSPRSTALLGVLRSLPVGSAAVATATVESRPATDVPTIEVMFRP